MEIFNKKQIEYLCKLWQQMYGEDFKQEYSGLYKIINRSR